MRRFTYSYVVFKSPNIGNITIIVVSKLRKAGHVKQMDENELVRSIMQFKME